MHTADDVSSPNPSSSSSFSSFSSHLAASSTSTPFHPSFEPGAFDAIPNPTSSNAAPGPLTPMVEMPVDTVYPASYQIDPFLEMCFDDETLSNIEKIYLFSRSKTNLHRSYMARNLVSYLCDVSPSEAIEYVLPLVNELAIDEDDGVQEALASALTPTLRWFFTNCPLLDDILSSQEQTPSLGVDAVALLSMSTVVAILTTLLISPSQTVCQETRRTVVDLISWPFSTVSEDIDVDQECANQQDVIQDMLLQQVVIGMSRWDMFSPQWVTDPQPQSVSALVNQADISNPITTSPSSFASGDQRRFSPRQDSSDDSMFSFSSGSNTPSSGSSSITSVTTTTSSEGEPTIRPSSPQIQSEQSSGQGYFEGNMKLGTSAPTGELNPDHGVIVAQSEVVAEQSSQQDEASDEAAMGRLSSMSLIASVTAADEGKALTLEVKQQFVSEVERVGKDALHWIRVEASFAMGALAKVVPTEIVVATLIPLFESFSTDHHPRVRHASVFSLPNILGRLEAKRRKSLAVSAFQRLAKDPDRDVRAGVLETLGETIYQFASDEEGPPEEITTLFLGPSNRGQDTTSHSPLFLKAVLQQAKDHISNAYTGQHGEASSSELRSNGSGQSLRSLFERKTNNFFFNRPQPEEDFFSDPSRPLICAYNYPAVILTMGRARWMGRLRDYYLELLKDSTYKIRHTLTASIGEVSKILGQEHTKRDTLHFWLARLQDEDSQLRLSAVQQLDKMLPLLDEADRTSFLEQLPVIWRENLTGWRERLSVVEHFPLLLECINSNHPVVCLLFRDALRDPVNAIRLQAVGALPYWIKLLEDMADTEDNANDLALKEICSLVTETTHRHRSTFVACYQALVFDSEYSIHFDPLRWLHHLKTLSQDIVVGVRIGVSRLIGMMCDKLYPSIESRPSDLESMVHTLYQDTEYHVRSYVAFLFAHEVSRNEPIPMVIKSTSFPSFSLPPPVSPTDEDEPFGVLYDASHPGHESFSHSSDTEVPLDSASDHRDPENNWIEHDIEILGNSEVATLAHSSNTEVPLDTAGDHLTPEDDEIEHDIDILGNSEVTAPSHSSDNEVPLDITSDHLTPEDVKIKHEIEILGNSEVTALSSSSESAMQEDNDGSVSGPPPAENSVKLLTADKDEDDGFGIAATSQVEWKGLDDIEKSPSAEMIELATAYLLLPASEITKPPSNDAHVTCGFSALSAHLKI